MCSPPLLSAGGVAVSGTADCPPPVMPSPPGPSGSVPRLVRSLAPVDAPWPSPPLAARLTPAGAASTWTYDAAGRETTRHWGAAAALTQSYDMAGRLTSQGLWRLLGHSAPSAPGGAPQPAYYDGQGRVVRSVTSTLSGQRRIFAYQWNAHDQLIGVTTPDGAI